MVVTLVYWKKKFELRTEVFGDIAIYYIQLFRVNFIKINPYTKLNPDTTKKDYPNYIIFKFNI